MNRGPASSFVDATELLKLVDQYKTKRLPTVERTIFRIRTSGQTRVHYLCADRIFVALGHPELLSILAPIENDEIAA